MGYVYVITDDTATKIGISKYPPNKARLRQLQTGNPRVLRLYAQRKTKHYKDVELEVHRRLSAYRLQGEWFSVTPQKALILIDDIICRLEGRSSFVSRSVFLLFMLLFVGCFASIIAFIT